MCNFLEIVFVFNIYYCLIIIMWLKSYRLWSYRNMVLNFILLVLSRFCLFIDEIVLVLLFEYGSLD